MTPPRPTHSSPHATPHFEGTERYVATRDLAQAVQAAVTLERPLLIKGEPGTGKTQLAYEIAAHYGADLLTWHVKSTTTAQQGLYEYDAVARLRDSQLGDPRVSDIAHYIRRGPLWNAFDTQQRVVLLIDEIDKADIEFPNDLLLELDRMQFYCYELGLTVSARQRPIVLITSNNEKELPDAFLRRCFFHYIAFPSEETMRQIVRTHQPELPRELLDSAMKVFYGLRQVRGLRKRPTTSELLDWLRLLIADQVTPQELEALSLERGELPQYVGALLKNEMDYQLFAAGQLRPSFGR